MDWLLFLAPVPDFINSRGSAGDTCRGSNLSYSIDLRHFHPAAAHNSLLWASRAQRKQEGSRSSVRNRLGGSTVELYWHLFSLNPSVKAAQWSFQIRSVFLQHVSSECKVTRWFSLFSTICMPRCLVNFISATQTSVMWATCKVFTCCLFFTTTLLLLVWTIDIENQR